MTSPVLKTPETALRWAAVLAIVAAGLIAYASSFRNEFVWDDASSVQLNKHVQDPKMFFQLFREDQHPFGRGQGNFYRPLVAASFMLDYWLAFDPAAQKADSPLPHVSTALFHFTNTAWHVAAALLLFALLTRIQAPGFVRFTVPVLYVVHPLHTEAVTYISGRADSMSAAFLLAALWFALYEGRLPRVVTARVLSALCFIGGLMSKEAATIFPFILLLFIVALPVESANRKKAYLVRGVPFAVSALILAVYAYLRMTVLHFSSGSATPSTTFGHRLAETCQAFALYVKLIFAPTGLHMERTLDGVSGWTTFAGALLIILCLAALVAAFVHKQRRVALGIGWFLLAWLPISGLFPLNAPMAEHWLYVPLMGFLWAFTELLLDASENPRWRAVVAGAAWILCVVFIAMTSARNAAWRDNETIFRDTLAKNPKSARVHFNLAVTYEDILKNVPGAKRHYEAVIALYKAQKKSKGSEVLYDDELEAHNSLGKICLQQGDFPSAAEHYRTILSVSATGNRAPLVASAAVGLGRCFLASGDMQRAGELFKKALQLEPGLKGEIERIVSAT